MVTEFMATRVSQNLNLQTECKTFEFNHGNKKESNIWKYNQVRLVPAIYVSICL